MSSPPNAFEALPEADQQQLIAIHFRARNAVVQAAKEHGPVPGLSTAVAFARVEFLDRELAPIGDAMAAAGTPVVCARGCSSCCTLTVEITPDEAFALAQYLEATLSPAELAAAKSRAIDAERRGRGLTPNERHALRIFCPVLDRETGACRGHPVRPVPCQGYLSLNRQKCEADHLGIPTPIPQPVAADFIRGAVMSARSIVLEESGYCERTTELSAALVAAWSDPAAEQRWLRGEDVFEEGGLP